MDTFRRIWLVTALGVWILLAFLQTARGESEEDGEAARHEAHFSGEATLEFRTVDGDEDSAKFEEYRDASESVSGDVGIRYSREDIYSFEFDGTELNEDDLHIGARSRWYGKGEGFFSFDKIPHRYAYDVPILFQQGPSGRLFFPDALQQELQDAPLEERAGRLQSHLRAAGRTDVETLREKAVAGVKLIALEPFSFQVEVSREDRSGERPFAGALGLNNNAGTVELVEPIDYETLEMRATASYASSSLSVNARYEFSRFRNHVTELLWDNPFRLIDSARGSGAADGPSRSLTALAPDNFFHSISLDGAWSGLPWKTRISASASRGWMKQNEDLLPYTTNTALAAGGFFGGAFDASDPDNLPRKDVDAEADTTTVQMGLFSRPFEFLHLKGQFRYFEYDNDTETIQFPGYVRVDSIWVDTAVENRPTSFRRMKALGEIGFDFKWDSRLTLSYGFEQTRRTNREVERQEDHTLRSTLDSRPAEWIDFRFSYGRTLRDVDDYDETVPLGSFYEGDAPREEQLPSLRKYTMADMSRDLVELLVTVYPSEKLTLSGSYAYGMDDFDSSDFGLLEDRHHILGFDVDYSPLARLNVFGYYNYERYDALQRASSLISVPDAGAWKARSRETVNTFGLGVRFQILPRKLAAEGSYAFSDVDGEIDFGSGLQGPADFNTVDEARLHSLNLKLSYRPRKRYAITLGYLWERFDYTDISTQGFSLVPTDTSDTYNGAILAGTLPEDYEASALYARLTFRF